MYIKYVIYDIVFRYGGGLYFLLQYKIKEILTIRPFTLACSDQNQVKLEIQKQKFLFSPKIIIAE